MVRTYVDRRGQYRRPVSLILWTVLYGGDDEDGILPATAGQLSEDYFLNHDDWMDGNLLRRKGIDRGVERYWRRVADVVAPMINGLWPREEAINGTKVSAV